MSVDRSGDVKKSIVLISLLLGAFLMQDVLAQEEDSKKESTSERIGDSVKKGGEAAGHGIEKGGEVVGHGLKKGGEATVKGLKKAGEWVGKELEIGGEKLQKATK
jgi:hypothetical protein